MIKYWNFKLHEDQKGLHNTSSFTRKVMSAFIDGSVENHRNVSFLGGCYGHYAAVWQVKQAKIERGPVSNVISLNKLVVTEWNSKILGRQQAQYYSYYNWAIQKIAVQKCWSSGEPELTLNTINHTKLYRDYLHKRLHNHPSLYTHGKADLSKQQPWCEATDSWLACQRSPVGSPGPAGMQAHLHFSPPSLPSLEIDVFTPSPRGGARPWIEMMDSINSLTFLMSFWFQRDQNHRLGNNLATQLLLRKAASLEINASHSSSVEKDGSLRWNVHSKCKLLDQI